MVRKMSVDVGEQKVMLAGQARGELFDHRSRGAVAGVPPDTAGAAGETLDQPIDIGVDDVDLLGRTFADLPVDGGNEYADPPNVGAEEGKPLKHHIEAGMVGGVVDAGYLVGTVHPLR